MPSPHAGAGPVEPSVVAVSVVLDALTGSGPVVGSADATLVDVVVPSPPEPVASAVVVACVAPVVGSPPVLVVRSFVADIGVNAHADAEKPDMDPGPSSPQAVMSAAMPTRVAQYRMGNLQRAAYQPAAAPLTAIAWLFAAADDSDRHPSIASARDAAAPSPHRSANAFT